jgi:glyoxylase-like metal-dependent hydrolase (beta-lactamase superfamily II)
MRVQRVGNIEIHKVTELPAVAMQATALMPNITPDILADGRTWLGRNFIEPDTDVVYLSFHSYVLKTPRHSILVDTCCGNDKSRESMPVWHKLNTPYLEELAAVGMRPEDIDIVLCTHLHADHVGWNTRLVDGRWVPTFPNARYVIGKHEYDYWQKLHASNPPTPVNRGSFVDSVLPVVERGLAMMVASDFCVDVELGDGVWLEGSPGHSAGHVCVHVKGGGQHVLLSGDAIHHPVQMTHPHVSIAADYNRAQATETRRNLLQRYADTATLLLTAHFPEPTAGHITRYGDNYRFKFLES